MRRGAFRWKRLLDAPVIAIPLADPRAYVERYSEADKRASGLGAGTEAWPAPYWTVDTSMSVMTMLLAAEDVGLGALFFGIFRGERELRRALGIPPVMQILGAIALGYPAPGRRRRRHERRHQIGIGSLGAAHATHARRDHPSAIVAPADVTSPSPAAGRAGPRAHPSER